ncbi:MAG: VOC family protein, partial [Atopobiaceae bacterium]|nr:VOC family protein [Atopobiaceae bacterium]
AHDRGGLMRAKIIHRNTHVYDLDATLAFYEKAFGFTERRRKGPEDGSWLIVFIGNDESDFELELTWNRGRTEPYENGGKDVHIAFRVDDFDAYHDLHERMGCIVRENPRMGLYFIADPDGQWIEILPTR